MKSYNFMEEEGGWESGFNGVRIELEGKGLGGEVMILSWWVVLESTQQVKGVDDTNCMGKCSWHTREGGCVMPRLENKTTSSLP